MHSFFYSKIAEGESAISKWTKKYDIFAYEKIFIPINLKMHWTLLVIFMPEKKINCYDPLFLEGGNIVLENIKRW